MRLILRASACVLVVAVFSAFTSGHDAVPTPTVTHLAAGHPGSPEHDYPFFSTDIVLPNYGYVEEECMCEGTAYLRRAGPDGSVEIACAGFRIDPASSSGAPRARRVSTAS
jgi:hypothetical protein